MHKTLRAMLQILEEAALHEQYTRVISMEPALNEETEDVCALIKECSDLRCAVYFPTSLLMLLSPSP